MKQNLLHEIHPCVGFELPNAEETYEHFHGRLMVVRNYGDFCNGHYLHTWDDGGRRLCRCSECRGLVLVQRSEYHGGASDDYYTDYFPVHSYEEADQLNEIYGGFQIEQEWKNKWISMTNGSITGHNWEEKTKI